MGRILVTALSAISLTPLYAEFYNRASPFPLEPWLVECRGSPQRTGQNGAECLAPIVEPIVGSFRLRRTGRPAAVGLLRGAGQEETSSSAWRGRKFTGPTNRQPYTRPFQRGVLELVRTRGTGHQSEAGRRENEILHEERYLLGRRARSSKFKRANMRHYENAGTGRRGSRPG
jgi:hypothetical protein